MNDLENMTMYEYVKQMSEDEMQRFVYWVYSCGNDDGFNFREDSPNCSFFGSEILKRSPAEVIESVNSEDSYGFDWR